LVGFCGKKNRHLTKKPRFTGQKKPKGKKKLPKHFFPQCFGSLESPTKEKGKNNRGKKKKKKFILMWGKKNKVSQTVNQTTPNRGGKKGNPPPTPKAGGWKKKPKN